MDLDLVQGLAGRDFARNAKTKHNPLRQTFGLVDKCLFQFSKCCPDVHVAILAKNLA